MSATQAQAEQEKSAHFDLLKRLADLRALVNGVESTVMIHETPRLLPLAIKLESVEEALEIWEAVRYRRVAEMRDAV